MCIMHAVQGLLAVVLYKTQAVFKTGCVNSLH